MNAHLFSALAEPNRFQIVELLKLGPLTVGDISEKLDLRQPQASKHLRVLLDTGIVEVQAEANRRIYRLRKEPFQEMEDWLKSISRTWEDRFDRLEQYLQMQQERGSSEPDKGKN
ncbi:metalloregulator ArsR/SmtB family transcription factor [Paenibacillus woosongensis]|uniref:Metalloregulator ArsR/SmtB family transcription factor n=2 Tax=Paenibacillus woosongensis TaxID=307580 RepID=A0A7X2Z2Z3_9BACL|nr:metalloregulator ArsR/SmtB family transcription factor [Paenibacillus woosongensis]MUG45911.1 metalloregulator ArsR/SmtB family transcription factor [Paenibacillus woosongensis]